jgi:hypothetical protein
MNRDEHRLLVSERDSLRRILEGIPEEDVLDRGSFEARLHEVERDLTSIAADTRTPARARLTFRGRPVIGSHGIFAEFGMTATKAFTDVVSRLAAGPLAPTGPIPDRDQNQLLITSTAIGSFGFELEEYREEPLLLADESAVAQALERTQQLLEGTAGSDDDLADAAAGVDPRAIAALRGFLDTLAKHEAY